MAGADYLHQHRDGSSCCDGCGILMHALDSRMPAEHVEHRLNRRDLLRRAAAAQAQAQALGWRGRQRAEPC